MGDWIRGLQRVLGHDRARPRAQETSRPGIESLENRNLLSITTSPELGHFVEAHAPAAPVAVMSFLDDGNGTSSTSNYSIKINWGDGSATDSTSGSINFLTTTAKGSIFEISGQHTFAQAGTFYPTVLIHNSGGGADSLSLTNVTVKSANQNFIENVYADLLHRPADDTGIAAWTAALQTGATRTDVVQAIEKSVEYRTDLIQGMYQQFLHRPGEGTGVNAWLDYLAKGHTSTQMEVEMLASPEYYHKFGHGTNIGFLQSLYSDLFHRSLDAAGAQVWGGALDSALPRNSITSTIVHTPEGAQNAVKDLYSQLLRRKADAAGLAIFASSLKQGASQEAVAAALLSSSEYFAR